jgi:hypothetical protein
MDVTSPAAAARPRSAARLVLTLLLALCVMAPTSWILWESTLPGGPVCAFTLLGLPALFAGALWAVALVRFVARKAKNRPTGSGVWLVIAPVGAAVVLVLASSDVLLRARFALHRTAFDEVAAVIPAAHGTNDFIAVPWTERDVGSYTITGVYRIGAGVIFYERHGGFLDDAGFAHRPHGPDGIEGNGRWEHPQFRHLEGPWYAWTASW